MENKRQGRLREALSSRIFVDAYCAPMQETNGLYSSISVETLYRKGPRLSVIIKTTRLHIVGER